MKTQIVRFSLIMATIASCAVTALILVNTRQKISSLQTNLRAQTIARVKAESDLRGTEMELHTTAASLTQTKAVLVAMAAEKAKASEEAAAQAKHVAELRAELRRTVTERDAALDELAPFHTANITAGEALRASKQLARLQETVAAIQEENRILAVRLKRGSAREQDIVRLPAGLRGKIMVCDPKWQFVVLDVGAKDGILERGELLVNRNGELVGKVKVTRVERDRAIANVQADWDLDRVIEGDVVIPAYPES